MVERKEDVGFYEFSGSIISSGEAKTRANKHTGEDKEKEDTSYYYLIVTTNNTIILLITSTPPGEVKTTKINNLEYTIFTKDELKDIYLEDLSILEEDDVRCEDFLNTLYKYTKHLPIEDRVSLFKTLSVFISNGCVIDKV